MLDGKYFAAIFDEDATALNVRISGVIYKRFVRDLLGRGLLPSIVKLFGCDDKPMLLNVDCT